MRRLPGPVRWLWLAMLALVGLELVLLVLGLVVGDTWLWAALQLMSITAAPLALGVLIVVVAAARSGRAAPLSRRERLEEPDAPMGAARPAPGSESPPEVAAIQRASQAVIALARTPEGKAAIRNGARLLRAGRAAMRPPPERAPEPGSRTRRDDEPG